VKGQRLDCKTLSIFVLKFIDVLESYSLTGQSPNAVKANFPQHLHVFKVPELFAFVACVFGKMKDEKDIMRMKMTCSPQKSQLSENLLQVQFNQLD